MRLNRRKKSCRMMSISENPVRRSDARPMRPAQTRRQTMRVMVFVKATEDSEKGFLPTPEATEAREAMGRFNEAVAWVKRYPNTAAGFQSHSVLAWDAKHERKDG